MAPCCSPLSIVLATRARSKTLAIACGALVLAATSAALTGCANRGGGDSTTMDAATVNVVPDSAVDPNDPHFQGVITMELRHFAGSDEDEVAPAGSENLTLSAKGDSYRWDVLEGSVARGDFRLYDRSAHRFYTIFKSESLILATPESGFLMPDATSEVVPHYDLHDDQRTGSVLGHACQMYTVRVAPNRYEVCASTEFTPLPFHMLESGFAKIVPFGGDLLDRGFFPLFVNQFRETTADGGVEKTSTTGIADARARGTLTAMLRVQAIEKKRLDPTTFDIPNYVIRRTQFLQNTGKMLR